MFEIQLPVVKLVRDAQGVFVRDAEGDQVFETVQTVVPYEVAVMAMEFMDKGFSVESATAQALGKYDAMQERLATAEQEKKDIAE